MVAVIALLLWRKRLMGETMPRFSMDANPGGFAEDPLTRVLTLLHYTVRHAGLLLWPHLLCCDYSRGSIPLVTGFDDPRNLGALALYAALAAAARETLLRRPRGASPCARRARRARRS